ncbi:hypothetical protein ABZ178_03850 [Streptomyces massasporeus]|uniref:hypothetical protein n=1 Tax=Streptomyces massasporeus TaxID=67324 RepID=UPI00167C0D19|nr:hypothetical protein [Streptomyces massasporeus]
MASESWTAARDRIARTLTDNAADRHDLLVLLDGDRAAVRAGDVGGVETRLAHRFRRYAESRPDAEAGLRQLLVSLSNGFPAAQDNSMHIHGNVGSIIAAAPGATAAAGSVNHGTVTSGVIDHGPMKTGALAGQATQTPSSKETGDARPRLLARTLITLVLAGGIVGFVYGFDWDGTADGGEVKTCRQFLDMDTAFQKKALLDIARAVGNKEAATDESIVEHTRYECIGAESAVLTDVLAPSATP